MNIRDLHYVVRIAELGSMVRAAEACHISPSTLSIQLGKLEKLLGVQIFERTNKRVMLTRAGEDIVSHAKTILHQVEALKNVAAQAHDPRTGEVRVGAFPTLAPYWFPHIVPRLKDKFPQMKLRLVEEKTDTLIQLLRDGAIDCAALAAPIEDKDFDSAPLFEEPFLLAVPAVHALAKRMKISSADLGSENLLLLEEGHCLRGQALAFCHHIGASEAGNYRATSLETLRNMVISGAGLTIMPQLAVPAAPSPMIRYIPFAAPAPGRSIGLYWRKTSARQALFHDLHTVLRGYPVTRSSTVKAQA